MSARMWVYLGVGLMAACVAGAWGVVAWLQYEPPNYDEIEPGVYVGGLLPAPPPGSEAVLNLCEHADKFRLPVESHQPIPDAEPAPSLEWLRKQVKFIDDQRNKNRKVFIHCQHGVSRSGMMIIAWLMARNHWRRAEAEAFAKSKRDEITPNPVFDDLLAEWEREIFKEPAPSTESPPPE